MLTGDHKDWLAPLALLEFEHERCHLHGLRASPGNNHDLGSTHRMTIVARPWCGPVDERLCCAVG